MKGATFLDIYNMDLDDISIHAPVKGATDIFKQTLKLFEISIHAPVKGATEQADEKYKSSKFQSTPP